MHCDTVWQNARLLTMIPGAEPVADGLVAARDGRIIYAGSAAGAAQFEPAEIVDCQRRWITPALIGGPCRDVRCDSRKPAIGDLDPHVAGPSAGQQGFGKVQAGAHCGLAQGSGFWLYTALSNCLYILAIHKA